MGEKIWYNKHRNCVYYTLREDFESACKIFLTMFGNALAQLYQIPSELWYNNYN